MPGNLPIPGGHILANIETLPYCHLCEEYSELSCFLSLLTLGHLKLLFIHGQITPNSVTHPYHCHIVKFYAIFSNTPTFAAGHCILFFKVAQFFPMYFVRILTFFYDLCKMKKTWFIQILQNFSQKKTDRCVKQTFSDF